MNFTKQKRIFLYKTIEQYLRSGLGIKDAIKNLDKKENDNDIRKIIKNIKSQLELGHSLAMSLNYSGSKIDFPPIEISLIEAGEKSGQLPDILADLENSLKQKVNLISKIRKDLLPSIISIHLIIFLYPIVNLFSGQISFIVFSLQVGIPLIILYGAYFKIKHYLLIHTAGFPIKIENYLISTFYFGRFLRYIDLSNFILSYSLLYKSGVERSIIHDKVIQTIFFKRNKKNVTQWLKDISNDNYHNTAINEDDFPENFIQMWSTAIDTGTEEKTLQDLHRIIQQQITEMAKTIGKWIPKIVYSLVAAVIFIKIYLQVKDHFTQIDTIIDDI